MLAAFDHEADPLTRYVALAMAHLVERGFTPELAARALALELKLPASVVANLAGLEAHV